MSEQTFRLIPLSVVPSQEFSLPLDGYLCRLWLRQLATGLYLDLWGGETLCLAGCLCVDRVDVLRGHLSELHGKLYFRDTQGTQDPDYLGFKNRFQLIYET